MKERSGQIALKLRVDQSWRPGSELELYRLREGQERNRWFLGVLDYAGNDDPGTGPDLTPTSVPFPDSAIERIEALLAGVSLTLQPDVIVGEDGVDYRLELTGFGVTATFKWWLHPPAGWQALEDIVELLIEQAGPVCRLYRDRYG